jgi:hypothetical protein
MAKESALALIQQAERTTTAIQEHARQASDALRRGLGTDSAAVNALGVFMEPQLRMNDLLTAREEIDAALEKLRNTAWPKDSDYRESGLS